jgi:hypothetical protein
VGPAGRPLRIESYRELGAISVIVCSLTVAARIFRFLSGAALLFRLLWGRGSVWVGHA